MSLTLSPTEIAQLCPGLIQSAARLRHLREQGFVRARLAGGEIVLERSHYEAVCRGEFAQPGGQGYDRPRIASLAGGA
jgi:hypothetical protein